MNDPVPDSVNPQKKITKYRDGWTAPFPTKIEYVTDSEGFNGPRRMSINGQPVTAVRLISVEQKEGDYNDVTIVFRGVLLVANPPADESETA